MNEFNQGPTQPSPQIEAVARVMAMRWFNERNVNEDEAAEFVEANWNLFVGDAHACVHTARLYAWAPIETAPWHGVSLDLWVVTPDDPKGHRVVDCYREGSDWYAKAEDGTWEKIRSGYPTHWMLVPGAPEREVVSA